MQLRGSMQTSAVPLCPGCLQRSAAQHRLCRPPQSYTHRQKSTVSCKQHRILRCYSKPSNFTCSKPTQGSTISQFWNTAALLTVLLYWQASVILLFSPIPHEFVQRTIQTNTVLYYRLLSCSVACTRLPPPKSPSADDCGFDKKAPG